MTRPFPYLSLQSSDRSSIWTLPPRVSSDYFSLQNEGAGALLLIGMHLSDAMPWTCARNPLHFVKGPGLIDLESKRILGKRFRIASEGSLESHSSPALNVIDPIALVLERLSIAGHSFQPDEEAWPDLKKEPGKLLPRKLSAKAFVSWSEGEIQLASRNFSEISQCLHAEVTLIFALSRLLCEQPRQVEALDEFRLETTLKPCRMCAAFLHAIKGNCRSFAVAYLEDDPGPLAANTLLDRFGYEYVSCASDRTKSPIKLEEFDGALLLRMKS